MIFRTVPHLNLEPPVLRQIGFKLAKVNGLNFAQGLCIMPTPQIVIEGAKRALANGQNLYSAAAGVSELREAIAERLNEFNRCPYTAESVVVTNGSTGAFEAVCQSFLQEGDEVVSFRPFYPYHQNALSRIRAAVKYVDLQPPEWSFRIENIERMITPRTRFILLNTPNNPTGKIFSTAELEQIAKLCHQYDLFCVTDEVYEYITYGTMPHVSMASLPHMFDRTITMSSYSKTFAITGWRIGFLAAPPKVADILRVTFDQIAVCAPTPLQHGTAIGIRELGEAYFNDLRATYARKKEILRSALIKAGFATSNPAGAYYLIADTQERFPGRASEEVAEHLVNTIQIGAVPAIDFIGNETRGDPNRSNFLRFSYAVPDEMLEDGATRLQRL